MKIPRSLFMMILFFIAQCAGAVPSQINYQGTLKQKNLPANGSYAMLFRITNQDGTQVYWSSAQSTVTVSNGLFSVQLAPAGVDWANVVPYMEVSVQGQLLAPREPVASTVYALMSASVPDGSITREKLDASLTGGTGAGVVPSGAIMLFAGPCPTGWTRFSALDNNFPMGASQYGTTGGSATHTHSMSGPNSVSNNQWLFGDPQGSGSHADNLALANHTHSLSTESNLPPYLTVIFCQKN